MNNKKKTNIIFSCNMKRQIVDFIRMANYLVYLIKDTLNGNSRTINNNYNNDGEK